MEKNESTLFVLAGGMGSRLSGVLGETPKALAPIAGYDFGFLEFQMTDWVRKGIKNFVFMLHYKADNIIEALTHFKSTTLKECEIRWVVEDAPLDTGGAISNAIEVLNYKGDFMLVNADTWIKSDFCCIESEAAPAMAVVKINSSGRYGMVEINENHKIIKFTEKNSDQKNGWISLGLLKLSSNHFGYGRNKRISLEKEILPEMARKEKINAVLMDTEFIDIGVPLDYLKFQKKVGNEK